MKNPVDFYEIYDYYYQPFWTSSGFKIISFLLILIVLVIVAYFFIKRFIKKEEPKLMPWEWALKKLTSFPLKKCNTKSDYKKFYFYLTDVIKTYFHKRFEWETEDKTDAELIKYVENKNLDNPSPIQPSQQLRRSRRLRTINKKLVNNLRQLTESALWIKYANEDALKTQAEKDLEVAQQIVKETTGNNNAKIQ